MVFLLGMKVISMAICITPLAGCAMGLGVIFGNLLTGVCRNPDAYEMAFGAALLGLAMIEVFAFLSIIVGVVIYVS